jgi:hypothetical protein
MITYCCWRVIMIEIILVTILTFQVVLACIGISLLKVLGNILKDTIRIEAIMYREERRQQAKR